MKKPVTTTFGAFLQRVQLTQFKLGPFTWKIEPTGSSLIAHEKEKGLGASEEDLIQRGIKDLESLIHRIENFDADAGRSYYLGSTLIRCDSFLEDNGISGEPLELTRSLMAAIDEETSNFIGGIAPYVPLKKLNTLKRSLKQILAELYLVEISNAK